PWRCRAIGGALFLMAEGLPYTASRRRWEAPQCVLSGADYFRLSAPHRRGEGRLLPGHPNSPIVSLGPPLFFVFNKSAAGGGMMGGSRESGAAESKRDAGTTVTKPA